MGHRQPTDQVDNCAVIVNSSSFTNSELSSRYGTFVSRGRVDIQRVLSCRFVNMSSTQRAGKKNVSDTAAIATLCVMSDCAMEEAEDTIHGWIVTGITNKTLRAFECQNSTFARCHRRTIHPLPPLSHLETMNECPSGTYSSSITFSDCSSSAQGGALYIYAESTFLTTLYISTIMSVYYLRKHCYIWGWCCLLSPTDFILPHVVFLCKLFMPE